jgi:predicted xylose isomerase-like sugar epimerase
VEAEHLVADDRHRYLRGRENQIYTPQESTGKVHVSAVTTSRTAAWMFI